MGLIFEQSINLFDLSKVRKGYLFWGRRSDWLLGRAGIVSTAEPDRLTILYCSSVGNVTSHLVVPASEVAAGKWEIRISTDMQTVESYGFPEDTEECEEEDNGGGADESSGADL